MTVMLDYIRTLIPVNWKSSPGGWTSGNCPMCVKNGQARPDTRGRGGFYFEEEKFQYNCFNCNFKTGWSPGSKITVKLRQLLTTFGADESEIQRIQLEMLREADVATLLIQREEKKKTYIDWKEMALPQDAKPINQYENVDSNLQNAIEYLFNRGLDPLDNNFWYSPSSNPGRMKNRFIIPFWYKGKVVGYTARWIGNAPDGMTKYFNQQPKRNFVYGLDRQTYDKQIVIVTEGPLDAIVTDGVAIGSNNINDEQADIIDDLQKRVVFLPDADEASLKGIDMAVKRGWEVSFPDWDDCKDVGDALTKYGRLFTIKSILESTVSNSTKIQVLARKYCK